MLRYAYDPSLFEHRLRIHPRPWTEAKVWINLNGHQLSDIAKNKQNFLDDANYPKAVSEILCVIYNGMIRVLDSTIPVFSGRL